MADDRPLSSRDPEGRSPGPGPRRVAIVYQVLHHFREPVFRALCERNGDSVDFTLFAAAENRLDSNKTIDPSLAELPREAGGLSWRFVRNRILPGGLLWQSGVLRIAVGSEFDTLIFLGNVHYLSSWLGAIAAHLRGKRVLMWGHGLKRPDAGPKWWVRKLFYRLADSHLLYGRRAVKLLSEGGIDERSLRVVYNSLDYARQKRVRENLGDADLERLRRGLFEDPSIPVVICIGRVDARKRIDWLLAAAAGLRERGTTVNVLIVGEGPAKEPLQRQSGDLGLSDHVVFYGACYEEDEIGPLIAMSSICVCPEQTGLTAIHAMAYGTPILTNDRIEVQGPEVEAIVPDETGGFFDAEDPSSLEALMLEWIERVGRDETIRGNCIEMVERFYTPEKQADAIVGCVLEREETRNASSG